MTLLGTFHIHGVSQEASIPATVILLSDAVRVSARTPLNLKSYKIGHLSKALGILRMHDEILVHLDVTFTPAPEGATSATARPRAVLRMQLPIAT